VGPNLPAVRRRWGWPQYLALTAVPILIWNVWTVVAWVADGPFQITEFRDHGSLSWWAARVFEGGVVVLAVVMIVYLIRGCRREGQILTFDVLFCLAGATLFYADFSDNFVQPVFMATSNLTNLNDACGYMPFVINPDCSRAPHPILLYFMVETFGLLAVAVVATGIVSRIRARRPQLTFRQLFVGVIVAGVLVDFAFEIPAVVLGLWTYNAGPLSLHFGRGLRLPIIEVIGTGLWFGLIASVRIFKDDRGRTFVERGMDHYSPKLRKGVTWLALYAVFQALTWGPGTAPVIVSGFYEKGWDKLPKDLVNNLCDAPGIEGSRYGPCPGDPDYRLPGRGSLTSRPEAG
jgi:hypothetical protein